MMSTHWASESAGLYMIGPALSVINVSTLSQEKQFILIECIMAN
jgi:hypothetical protein